MRLKDEIRELLDADATGPGNCEVLFVHTLRQLEKVTRHLYTIAGITVNMEAVAPGVFTFSTYYETDRYGEPEELAVAVYYFPIPAKPKAAPLLTVAEVAIGDTFKLARVKPGEKRYRYLKLQPRHSGDNKSCLNTETHTVAELNKDRRVCKVKRAKR